LKDPQANGYVHTEVAVNPGEILVVEDEGLIALHIEEILGRAGYHVQALIPSGELALQYLDTSTLPDLILMDIGLGGKIDGIETARQIRKRHAIPIVFISAYSSQNRIDEALAVSPGAYLLKPFEEKDLIAAVRRGIAFRQG